MTFGILLGEVPEQQLAQNGFLGGSCQSDLLRGFPAAFQYQSMFPAALQQFPSGIRPGNDQGGTHAVSQLRIDLFNAPEISDSEIGALPALEAALVT